MFRDCLAALEKIVSNLNSNSRPIIPSDQYGSNPTLLPHNQPAMNEINSNAVHDLANSEINDISIVSTESLIPDQVAEPVEPLN